MSEGRAIGGYSWEYRRTVFWKGRGGNYAVNDEDFRWVVVHQLELHGWRVRPIHIGRPMGHLEKQLLIKRALKKSLYRLRP